MRKVIIYTTDHCPYCSNAKMLLEKKGVQYEEIRLDLRPELVDEVREKCGGSRTVPQIFIDDLHIGGCDDLYELEYDNKLDGLLKR